MGIQPQINVVSVTSTSATFATLLGAALNTSTKRVTVRPHAGGIFLDDGTASASSDPLGTSAVEMDGGPSELGSLQFYAAGATNMTVIQEGG